MPILVRSDLSLAADVAVRQPLQACRDLVPGDHLDRRQTDRTLDVMPRKSSNRLRLISAIMWRSCRPSRIGQ
jgi:hypothetical protein